jgi:hypothetical protein
MFQLTIKYTNNLHSKAQNIPKLRFWFATICQPCAEQCFYYLVELSTTGSGDVYSCGTRLEWRWLPNFCCA